MAPHADLNKSTCRCSEDEVGDDPVSGSGKVEEEKCEKVTSVIASVGKGVWTKGCGT